MDLSTSAPAVHSPPRPTRLSRLRRSRRFKPYNRLAAAVILLNLLAVAVNPHPTAEQAFVAAGVNVFVAAIVRQQYVINALFALATRARDATPLRVRWGLGKIYSFGGVHVGAAVSATGWYIAFCALTVAGGPSPLFVATSILGSLILVSMLITALPKLAARVEAELRRIPEIRTLHSVSGQFDMIAVVVAPSIGELDGLIDRIGALEGVERTMSSIILSTRIER